MADYTSALIQLGTLAASMLAQKEQQKRKEKLENESLARESGRAREDARFQMLVQAANEMGAPGAGYLATAGRANQNIARAGEDLKRNQSFYEDEHANDYLAPALGMLGRNLTTSSSRPNPQVQIEEQQLSRALAPSAASAGAMPLGADEQLEEAMRRYGYRDIR